MEPDPIEIRIVNYFEYRHTVKETTMADLANLETLLPELKPIPITSRYLARLNFVTVTDNESVRHFQKSVAAFTLTCIRKEAKFLPYILIRT
jgi:hypothetical protein